ncbi:MAG: PAS domain S-box protein, partial [Gammaproteobacteria bacterium]|nr:PAS domain S-box protein [Gammaproteobacteria bacterium]
MAYSLVLGFLFRGYYLIQQKLKESNDQLELDIIKRKRVVGALRESEQQVKDLLDSTAEAIYGLDMHGGCIFANPACVRILGYRDAGELIGRNTHDLIHLKRPDGTPYPTDECPIFHAFLSGTGTHVDTEVLWRDDGSSFPAEYWSYPIRRDGEVIGAVVTFLDITERRQAEQELLSEKQLSEEYINSLPGLFYVFDKQRLVRWNREWNRITGYSDEELGSRYGTDFVGDEDRRLLKERMLKVFREGAAEVEAKLVTKDGRRIPYYFTGLRKQINGRDHLVGLGMDITERKQARAERDRLQRELQQAQKMEAVGQLTGGIAHDFNNILGIILGFAEIGYNQCLSSGQTKTAKYLSNIQKAGNRAAALVSQMLAFSRKEGGEYQYRSLQLAPLIKEDIKLLRSTLPTSIEIKTKFEDHLPEVLTDPTQLHQALMNLAINARDAMEGKGVLTIRLVWAREKGTECAICHQQVQGDWVELSVSDTGAGIEPEIMEHIFNPFFTTKAVGKGTGMGLAVILGIVRRHGGHALVESKPGKGTTFRMLFPGRRGDQRDAGSGRLSAEPLPGQGEHVLVVDDEPDLGDFIGDLLESHGYLPTVLTSSKKAL